MLLFFEDSHGDISKTLYVRSRNISVDNWAEALQTSTLIAKSLTECGGYCMYQESTESHLCNAFEFVKESSECNLASVTFLEDTQEGVENLVSNYYLFLKCNPISLTIGLSCQLSCS